MFGLISKFKWNEFNLEPACRIVTQLKSKVLEQIVSIKLFPNTKNVKHIQEASIYK